MPTIQSYLRMFAIAWLALSMAAPVSAWTVHAASHSAAQVDVDDHHHHEDDGGISVHDHDDGEAPDGGHEHMPSILLGALAMPDSGTVLSALISDRVAYDMLTMYGIVRQASDAIRRPPRLG